MMRQKESRNTWRQDRQKCEGRKTNPSRGVNQNYLTSASDSKESTCTITQVLVVLAFMVDIFTIVCSFFSCSIKDL